MTAAILGAVLGLALRWRSSFVVASGLLAPLLLLVAGVPLAGVRALSGPPLAALALAGLVCVAAGAGLRVGGPLFLPLAFGVLVAAAGRSHVQVGPEGDEPHYLMVADSLLRDGDLSLERDYAEGRYAAFHDAPLAPHYRVRGKGGAIYSLHAVGLSILILPAWAIGGYAGVTAFMALLAAFLAREVREWVSDLTGNQKLAEAAGWLAVLTPPLIHYAGLVFTEVPAALALSVGLRLARRDEFGVREAVVVGCAAAAMAWLNVRYAPLGAVVVAHALWRHPRVRALLGVLVPCTLSAAGLLLYHQALYGFWDPRRVYGRSPEFALSTLAEGLPGLLLDQEFGLLVYAPVLVLALPGFVLLLRRDRGLAVAAGCGRRRGRADGRDLAHVARRLQPAGALPGADRAAAGGGRGPGLREARLDRGRGAPRRLEPLDRPRGRVGAAARPSRPRRHGSVLPRAVGRARVDGAAARLRALGPRSSSPRGGVGRGAAGRRAVADASGERASAGGREPRAGCGRAGRGHGLAPAHRRSGRGAARRPRGSCRSPAGDGARRVRAGDPSPSDGAPSTSRTVTRPAPRSAGDWRCLQGATG